MSPRTRTRRPPARSVLPSLLHLWKGSSAAVAIEFHARRHSARRFLPHQRAAPIACGCRISPAGACFSEKPTQMSRSKGLREGSETNQSPRNAPCGLAADICDSLACQEECAPQDAECRNARTAIAGAELGALSDLPRSSTAVASLRTERRAIRVTTYLHDLRK